MTSILTNTGAMTALQTLRSINANLAQTLIATQRPSNRLTAITLTS